MAKVIISGLNPTAPVLNYFSLMPSLGYTGDVNNRKMMNFQMYENTPVLPEAISRSNMLLVKPLKPIETMIKVIRRPPMSNTIGIRPTTGIGRGQSKGLAFDTRHPIDTKIMQQSSNFNASLNNPLGQPN